MDAVIRQFTASDDYRLHYRHWQPIESPPRGYVVALHGIQSHSGWYEFSSRRMCEAGYDVRFLDRRGSGLNGEAPGDAPHCDRLVNDVVQMLAEVRHQRNREAPAGPVALLAVSWGGKLAAVTAARRAELVDGLALLSPGICARIGLRWYHRLGLRLAIGCGLGQRQVRIPLDDPALFTADATGQQFIRDDELALRTATLRFLDAGRILDGLVAAAPARLRCPLLLMLAGRDRIIDNRATIRFFDRCVSSQRTLLEFPEARHTHEFEPNRGEIVDSLINWLHSVRGSC